MYVNKWRVKLFVIFKSDDLIRVIKYKKKLGQTPSLEAQNLAPHSLSSQTFHRVFIFLEISLRVARKKNVSLPILDSRNSIFQSRNLSLETWYSVVDNRWIEIEVRVSSRDSTYLQPVLWMTKMTSALCWLSWRPFFIKWLFCGADWLSSFVYLLGYHSGRCQARGSQVSAGIPRPLRVVPKGP